MRNSDFNQELDKHITTVHDTVIKRPCHCGLEADSKCEICEKYFCDDHTHICIKCGEAIICETCGTQNDELEWICPYC